MRQHRGAGRFGVAGFDGFDDGDVFLEADGVAARRGEQAADAVERHAGVLDRRTDAREAGRSDQQVVEGQVEPVKARAVVGLDRGVLVAQIAAQFGGERGILAPGQQGRRLGLQRAAQEHVLAHVGKADQRDGRAALRPDVDKALGLQPVERLGDRKARHAEARGQRRLVEHGAGLQLQGDDRLAQDLDDAVGGAALQGTGRRRK